MSTDAQAWNAAFLTVWPDGAGLQDPDDARSLRLRQLVIEGRPATDDRERRAVEKYRALAA
jgi:hypothetical protein